MSVLLSGCIVMYNNEPNVVMEAIHSFLNTTLNVTLYLIDNSPTNALESIKSGGNIVYIHNPINPGFGAAHNIAVKMAMQAGSQFHLVLNPDVYFEAGTLEKIVTFAQQNKDVGNIMPKVLYPDGQIQYLCKLLPTPYDWIGRRFNPSKNAVKRRNEFFELRFTGYNKTMEVPYLSGCFMFLNLEAVKTVGFFDENIFMYGEETDLCRRLINGGYKTVFYPAATICHHFEKGSHKSWRLTWIGIQSAIYYFNKWGWFFDKERRDINKLTLKKLNYSG